MHRVSNAATFYFHILLIFIVRRCWTFAEWRLSKCRWYDRLWYDMTWYNMIMRMFRLWRSWYRGARLQRYYVAQFYCPPKKFPPRGGHASRTDHLWWSHVCNSQWRNYRHHRRHHILFTKQNDWKLNTEQYRLCGGLPEKQNPSKLSTHS